MKKPKASVITPVYNAEKTILGLLNALNSQTEKNFEYIVVDDGPTDDSIKTIKNFKAKFPMKILSQINSGPAKARNRGARNAKSDIIVFIDSGCVPKQDFLEKLIKPFEDNKISGVQAETETQNKESLIARYVSYEIYYRHESMKDYKEIDHVSTCACAYRKNDFGKGFSEKFKKADMEDTELSYRLSKQGKRLIFEPKAVVGHFHPADFGKFMKIQFSRGYWRAIGSEKHPDKIIKDSYLKYDILIQGILSLLFIASFFASIIWAILSLSFTPLFIILVMFILLIISNVHFGVYAARYELKMILLAPLIASCRSIMGTAGFLRGFYHLKMGGD